MINRPICEDGAAVNEAAGNRAENARIVGTDAMVAHHKIHVMWNAHGTVVAQILILRRDVRFRKLLTVHIDNPAANLHDFTWQRDDPLNEGLAAVQRIPENDYVTARNWFESIDKLVDEDALLVGKKRRHAGAFDLHRLIQKNDDDEREANRDQKVAGPDSNFTLEGLSAGRLCLRSN